MNIIYLKRSLSLIGLLLCHMTAKFGESVDEGHSKLPTLYWLPKLYK